MRFATETDAILSISEPERLADILPRVLGRFGDLRGSAGGPPIEFHRPDNTERCSRTPGATFTGVRHEIPAIGTVTQFAKVRAVQTT